MKQYWRRFRALSWWKQALAWVGAPIALLFVQKRLASCDTSCLPEPPRSLIGARSVLAANLEAVALGYSDCLVRIRLSCFPERSDLRCVEGVDRIREVPNVSCLRTDG
jgi:hypothetical protein